METEIFNPDQPATESSPIAGRIEAILADLRGINDERSRLSELDGRLSKKKQAIEMQLLDLHAETGLSAMKGGGMSVSFDENAMRATVQPEHWESVKKWLCDNGHSSAIQRRLTDNAIIEMVQGGVALPEGLTLVSYVKINARRY